MTKAPTWLPQQGQRSGTIQVMFTNYASAEGTTAYSEADMFVQWQEWLDSNKNANKRLWQNAVKLNNRSQFAKALHEIFPTDTFQMKANQGNRKAGETDAEKRERMANVKVCLRFRLYGGPVIPSMRRGVAPFMLSAIFLLLITLSKEPLSASVFWRFAFCAWVSSPV